MQEFTQKYTLAQLLEPMPEGTEYAASDWPLHVTLADVFATNWDVPTMVGELTRLLSRAKPFASAAVGNAYFGPSHQTHVTLLEKNAKLKQLHYDIIATLEKGGAVFNQPQFIREGFAPHSTVRPHARLQKGERVMLTAISIVDMFPGGDPYRRKILKTIPLAG